MAERERIEARLRQVQKMGPADRWHRARLQQYSRVIVRYIEMLGDRVAGDAEAENEATS
jgi:hypothetical protein